MPTEEQFNVFEAMLMRADVYKMSMEVMQGALEYLLNNHPIDVLQALSDACYDWDL